MNLSQYRLDEKLITIFEHLTDEQKIEVAIQKYSIQDVVRIFTYYELDQYTYAKKLFWEQNKNGPYELLYYSRDIIVGRWPEAEPIIMTRPSCAYYYAFHAIKGRWPEAEPAIMTDPYYAYLYSREVIKGRWPEAESVIMASPEYAYFYSCDVIKGRWPEAEPAIMKHSPYWRFYKDRFKL